MKKLFSILLGITVIIVLIIACSKSTKVPIAQKSNHLKDGEIIITSDSSFQLLITLSYNFVAKLKKSNIDTATIRRLINNNEVDSIAILAGIPVDTASAWKIKAGVLLSKLAIKYGITQKDTGQHCNCANQDKITGFNLILSGFRSNTENLDSVTTIIRGLYQSQGPPDGCLYAPYTACLIACVASGPWFYWLCAYACYCGFCYGPTRDGLCGSMPGGSGSN